MRRTEESGNARPALLVVALLAPQELQFPQLTAGGACVLSGDWE